MTRYNSIASLKHRVAICTMDDVVVDASTLSLRRAEVLRTWANIEAKNGSMFAKDGVAIMESRERQTHIICVRYRYDMVISSAAWVYEERLKSEPRWYKVLSVVDAGEFWKFKCRLVEKSDAAEVPSPVTATDEFKMDLPRGVVL